MTKRPYRQGDVLLTPVPSIPKNLQPVPRDNGRVILAHGEVTGHAHAVIGDVELLASDLQEMRERFLRVEQNATIVHEEHGPVTIPPGLYRVGAQVEYTPDAIVDVAD
jgi:hypothetical protein